MGNFQKDFAFLGHRFYAFLESLSIGVLVFDSELKIQFSNQTSQNFLGMDREQMRGRRMTELPLACFREDRKTMSLDEYPASRTFETGQPVKNQVMGLCPIGQTEPIWVQCQAYPDHDEEGNLTQIIVSLTNFTREKKLLDLNLLFETALDQSPAGIAIVEAPSGKLIYLNQAGFMMRGGGEPGQSVKDMDLNRLPSFWNLRGLDGVALKYEEVPLMRAINHGEETSAEFLLITPEQSDRIIWTNVAPVFRSDGTIMAGIAVFLDTTEFHGLQDQLKVAEMKSRFLDVAAHELRSPVTAFSLLLQFTQRQYAKGHLIDSSVLDRLRGQVDRISHLIDDLLDITRLQHGTVKLKFENRDIVSLVSECIADYQLRAPDRVFKLIKPEVAIRVNVDAVRIYQVLSNLLDNAIKYTDKKTQVEISIEHRVESVRVSVIDHGSGIPEDEQRILFLPFSRGTTGLKGHAGGLGLGLSICRGIIELHRGTIGLTSELGVGSTFFFEIPTLDRFPKEK